MKKRYLILLLGILILCDLYSFQADEKLTFTVKYGFIGAAEATMQVQEYTYKDSIPCWEFTTKTKTKPFFDHIFKVRDKIVSIVDREKFISYKFEKKLNEGSYKQHRIHLYYPDQNSSFYLKYSRKKRSFKETRMEIPDNTQDILSAFYSIRKMDLNVRDSVFINVTADGKNVITKVVVHKLEKIKTIFGKIECLVIEPIMETEAVFKQSGRIKIWLTNDARKIPVKMESKVTFGSFKAYLEEYEGITSP